MQREPSASPPSWNTNQHCIFDLFIILRDKMYWELYLKSDDADLRCIAEMTMALKKFTASVERTPSFHPINDIKAGSLTDQFHEFQRALTDIATKPREASRLTFLFSSDRRSASIMYLKIVVKNLLELDKSNDFDRLRIDYATYRKLEHPDMLVRAKMAMTERNKVASPEKKSLLQRSEHIKAYINNNEFITALFLYDEAKQSEKFNNLLGRIQLAHPSGQKTHYVQDPTLEALIHIIKDKSYWKQTGKTVMRQVIDRYEKLAQKLREAPRPDVAALQALDMALLKNLQALTPSLSVKEDNAVMLAAALHPNFDNFDDVKNSDGFQRLAKHHGAESADLKRVFRPGGRSL